MITVSISFIISSFIVIMLLLIFTIKKVVPLSPFLYSNARIQARTKFLISNTKFIELAECNSLRELANSLRETEYAEELDKVDINNLKQFQLALEKSFVASLIDLRDLSPNKLKDVFNAYLMFLEAKILKTIYRAVSSNSKLDKMLVFPVGNITSELLRHLLEAKTIADLRVVLEATPYKSVFSKDYSSLEEFEVALEEFIFNNFVKTIQKTKIYEGKYIIEILNTKIDILNLLALIKFRIRGIEKEKQHKLLIYNKTKLCERFEDLINSKDFYSFVDVCKELPYYEALVKALEKYKKDSSLLHFEHELYSYYKRFVIDAELYHTLGPYPLFSYLTKKEIELRNLFIISKGIELKFTAEKIKELII